MPKRVNAAFFHDGTHEQLEPSVVFGILAQVMGGRAIFSPRVLVSAPGPNGTESVETYHHKLELLAHDATSEMVSSWAAAHWDRIYEAFAGIHTLNTRQQFQTTVQNTEEN